MQAIILAAGKGTRFPGIIPKVLRPLCGKPLVEHIITLAKEVGVQDSIVVVGYQGEEVQQALHSKNIQFCWQRDQLGTGHAVLMALPLLKPKEDVLILYGDVPAIRKETLQALTKMHSKTKNVLTLLTATLEDPVWYGRILRDGQGNILGIKEAKDCTAQEQEIREIWSGVMIAQASFLQEALPKLRTANRQREYYLGDIVNLAAEEKRKVGAVTITDENEIKGVNSPEELEEMRHILERRKR